MRDFIEYRQKQAAVVLAETLDYKQAAARLKITTLDLKNQIASLESKLCIYIFKDEAETPRLTEDGHYLIQLFREALDRHRQGR